MPAHHLQLPNVLIVNEKLRNRTSIAICCDSADTNHSSWNQGPQVISRTIKQDVVIRSGAHPGGPQTRRFGYFRCVDTSQPHCFSNSCRTRIPVVTLLKTDKGKVLIFSSSNTGLSKKHGDRHNKPLQNECNFSIGMRKLNVLGSKEMPSTDLINTKRTDSSITKFSRLNMREVQGIKKLRTSRSSLFSRRGPVATINRLRFGVGKKDCHNRVWCELNL